MQLKLKKCNTTLLIVIFALAFFFVSGFDNPEDEEDKPPVTCGQNVTTKNGSFKLSINNLTDGSCIWLIQPNKTTATKPIVISLFFDDLFLDPEDKVTIYKSVEDSDNDTNSLIPPIGAQNGSVTVSTLQEIIVVKLVGNPHSSVLRKFGGMYNSEACQFAVPPLIQFVDSPTSTKNMTELKCRFTFSTHNENMPAFTFEEFNITSSTITLSGSTIDSQMNNGAVDFFHATGQKIIKMDVTMKSPSKDYFRLKQTLVNPECSGFQQLPNTNPFPITSPVERLDNGSIIMECRRVFSYQQGNILGISFDKLHLRNVLDILAVNDGGSETSTPLQQITFSNSNKSSDLSLRTSGNYMWLSFKPVSFVSTVSFNVTVHAHGGHYKGNGNFSVISPVGDDTVFLLEVDDGEIVQLKFEDSNFKSPAKLALYDGFDKTGAPLATLQGNIWYPVLSKSNKLRIVVTGFNTGSFKASFNGVPPSDCMHMSSQFSEDFILSGNCNKTCSWTIPPQDLTNSQLLLDLQYVLLSEGDSAKIIQLDVNKTSLAELSKGDNHVPKVAIPANVGLLVEINRAPCAAGNNDIVLVGHSSYVPTCNYDESLAAASNFSLFSPHFPDTYPVGDSCKWSLKSPKGTMLYLAFDKFHLAASHCIQITSANKSTTYEGSDMPDDLFLGDEAQVEFLTKDCKTRQFGKQLVTSEGFLINGTVAECGATLSRATDQFNTSISGKQSICIWKVDVPVTSDSTTDDVNIISYSITKKDALENYKLRVYDGSSVRDKQIENVTASEIWSRTNNLVFVYERLNISLPSAVLVFKYSTISCNSTMQCSNKICLHPDWRCNGINECGDFSDEKNCDTKPVNPVVTLSGYSSTTFWTTIFLMLAFGIALGIFVPVAIQKYRNGQYRRFGGDISVIE